MEPYEYQTLFEFETSYWWYRQLHSIIRDTILSLGTSKQSVILDAGCGTGQGLVSIQQDVTHQIYGFDISPHAATYWHLRGIHTASLASINQIPFQANTFDIAVSVDVLECSEVQESHAYAELWRVVKPDGYLILVVPAYNWLMSSEHHKAVHAVRRYTCKGLSSLLQECPIKIKRITHIFASVFPGVVSYRLILRLISHSTDRQPRSELQPIHPLLNQLLFSFVDIERRMLHSINMPFGSSILAVAQKINS